MKTPPISTDMSLSPEGYELKVQSEFYKLLDVMKRQASESELKEIRRAFEYAKDAHKTMFRKSGEPYILHPIAVAHIVAADMGLFATSVICALLHDVVEDTEITLEDIQKEFNNEVRTIVDGLTKIAKVENVENVSHQAENYRKILLTISDDIRVIFIKIADRLHNMRTLDSMAEHKRYKIASETFYLYAPLAYRLGLYSIKSELEDLSFKYLQPIDYNAIQQRITESKDDALAYIERFKQAIDTRLKNQKLPFSYEIKSRFKSIYSIHNKIIQKGVSFEEVYDLYAIRIILETREELEIADCLTVYTQIAARYRIKDDRTRNWLHTPKTNGYQALHVTVLGPDQKWVEIQIRTTRMDDIAERGLSAHWNYKGQAHFDEEFAEWIEEAKKILSNPDLNALEAVKAFRQNLQIPRIWVFTPKGDMISIPSNATALDFAYKIHTRIGESALVAKINGQTVPLDKVLAAGDQIEIITSKKSKPVPEWLHIVKTPKAYDLIKENLNRQRKEKIENGKGIFLRWCDRYHIKEEPQMMKELLTYLRYPTKEDFFVQLNDSKVNREKVTEFIQLKKEGKKIPLHQDTFNKEQGVQVNDDFLVLGKEFDINEYTLAPCCNPVLGDDIYAFADSQNKVIIHTTGCHNTVSLLATYGEKALKATWNSTGKGISYLAALKVEGADRRGMLIDLLKIISTKMQLNMRKVTIDAKNKYFEGLFLVYVTDKAELDSLCKKLQKVDGVNNVSRTNSNFEPFQD